jgi:hypothetical protein
MSLLIEERKKTRGLLTRAVLASRSGGGRFTKDGTHALEKLKTMVPSLMRIGRHPPVVATNGCVAAAGLAVWYRWNRTSMAFPSSAVERL